ncbi:hypothetical protein HYG86_06110 [Alkalicella caledoniensis]|uniref:Uncharacterized protein n=1 Tax=Alkalicella caledoniensis TaxID=2731377 RepID=A0A7G9W6R3_ALKCA|nr:hypothetical protein [Alkalicella caledoniensis]QNO14375.1 hypothetical protein HYG86_06110 [Alkalicella caledoniensis]
MQNTDWHYKRVLGTNTENKLSQIIIRDIIVVTMFIILAIVGVLIMLISFFKGLYFRIAFKDTYYFVGIAIVFISSIIFITNESINPLSKISINDKVFCWIHYLIKQINVYRSNQYNSLYQKLRLKFIIRIIVNDLYTLKYNLENSFVFLKDKEDIVQKVDKIVKLLNGYFVIQIDNEEIKEKYVELLNKLEKQYMLLIGNTALYSETDTEMANTSKEVRNLYNQKYDELFHELDLFITDEDVQFSSTKSESLLRGKKRYIILSTWVFAGFSLIFLIFKDERLATLIGSVVGVIAVLVTGIKYIIKK